MKDNRVFEFPIHYTTVIGQIAIGWGVHETVADECKVAGIKKALITTTNLKGTGIVGEITGILKAGGIATGVFNGISSNPKDYEIMAAYKVFKESDCDGVVSVGGGSSQDCGKGVRALAANDDKDICDMAEHLDPPWMEQIKKCRPATIPQISVNTTAGTGAESTIGTAIINTRIRAKELIMVPGLPARVGLIDPLLVRLMPAHIAAWTGFDVLSHAFESYTSRMRSQYNLALMLRAIKVVSKSLREFTYNRINDVVSEMMCWAESMAEVGIGFGGGIGIVYGLGHGLSVFCNCHHGRANAVAALPLTRYNEGSCPQKFPEMSPRLWASTLRA